MGTAGEGQRDRRRGRGRREKHGLSERKKTMNRGEGGGERGGGEIPGIELKTKEQSCC